MEGQGHNPVAISAMSHGMCPELQSTFAKGEQPNHNPTTGLYIARTKGIV